MKRREDQNWHIAGVIPEGVARQIGLEGRVPVWINDNIVGNIEDRHGKELRRMNTTAFAFVHRVVTGFNSVRQQDGDTLLLAIEGVRTSMVTYIKLELAAANFWRVKSAHIRPTGQVAKFALLWPRE